MKAPPCFCVRVIPTLARAASALASAWFAPVRMRSCVKNCVSLPLTRPLHAFLVNRAAAMILRFRNVFLESSTVCWTQFEHLSRMINLLRWIESTVSVYFDNSFDPTDFTYFSTCQRVCIFESAELGSKIFHLRVSGLRLETGMPLVCLLACHKTASYNIPFPTPQIRMYNQAWVGK